MFKLRAGALIVSAVVALAALAGCSPVNGITGTFALVYTPDGLAQEAMANAASEESESSQEETLDVEPTPRGGRRDRPGAGAAHSRQCFGRPAV